MRAGLVLEDHAFGRELVADAVGFLKILGLARCGAQLDQALYLGGIDARTAPGGRALADCSSQQPRCSRAS